MIRIVVAEDHNLVREGLCSVIKRVDGVMICADVPNGLLAVKAVREHHADLVLTDIRMPLLNGIEACRQIRKEFPTCKVIAVSAFSDESLVYQMLDAGAHGYVLKDDTSTELIRAIHAVMKGDHYLSTSITGLIVGGYVHGRAACRPLSKIDSLTNKERQLLQILSEGHSNKDAARILNVTTKTIDARRRAIMSKLGLYSLPELTKLAIRAGITSP